LEDIAGLGPARRAALLKQFGSVRKLTAATPDEIAEVPGIGPRLAETIVAALHRDTSSDTTTTNDTTSTTTNNTTSTTTNNTTSDTAKPEEAR
jgi:excinuclease ABC subunit C